MNKKIKKYLDEIAKTEKKIADLQQYLRGVQAALKQEEDNEMIRCIRGMKMENGQLYDLLDGIQNGGGKIDLIIAAAVDQCVHHRAQCTSIEHQHSNGHIAPRNDQHIAFAGKDSEDLIGEKTDRNRHQRGYR